MSSATLAEKNVVMLEEQTEGDEDTNARPEELRLIEALLFAAGEPVDEKALAKRLPQDVDVKAALRKLQTEYAPRGVNLLHVGTKWVFRTANDLAWLLTCRWNPAGVVRAAAATRRAVL